MPYSSNYQYTNSQYSSLSSSAVPNTSMHYPLMPQVAPVDVNAMPSGYPAQPNSQFIPMVQGYRPEAPMNQYPSMSSPSPYSMLTPQSPFYYVNSPQAAGNAAVDRNHPLQDPYMSMPMQRGNAQTPYIATQLSSSPQYTCLSNTRMATKTR